MICRNGKEHADTDTQMGLVRGLVRTIEGKQDALFAGLVARAHRWRKMLLNGGQLHRIHCMPLPR